MLIAKLLFASLAFRFILQKISDAGHYLLTHAAMLTSCRITFLGTSSAVPTSTRNHSSLALRLDSDVWLFDCGEAAQNRVQQSTIKMGKIRKIFITHTHGDHIFGLVPLLAGIMNGAGGTVGAEDSRVADSGAQEVRSLSKDLRAQLNQIIEARRDLRPAGNSLVCESCPQDDTHQSRGPM